MSRNGEGDKKGHPTVARGALHLLAHGRLQIVLMDIDAPGRERHQQQIVEDLLLPHLTRKGRVEQAMLTCTRWRFFCKRVGMGQSVRRGTICRRGQLTPEGGLIQQHTSPLLALVYGIGTSLKRATH